MIVKNPEVAKPVTASFWALLHERSKHGGRWRLKGPVKAMWCSYPKILVSKLRSSELVVKLSCVNNLFLERKKEETLVDPSRNFKQALIRAIPYHF